MPTPEPRRRVADHPDASPALVAHMLHAGIAPNPKPSRPPATQGGGGELSCIKKPGIGNVGSQSA